MADLDLIRELRTPGDTKIVLLVLDGLGGLPKRPGGRTELEAAKLKNLKLMAAEGMMGLQEPVGPGITPGSGPGHLGLFGYDPLSYRIGRGALEALGIGFDLTAGDLAARGNFCTVDASGTITDRRAGRISTELATELCAELSEKIELPDVELMVQPVREHRFLIVLRGPGLDEGVSDTDPGNAGLPPLEAQADRPEASHSAALVQSFVDRAGEVLAEREPANMITLRGFASRPDWPLFPDVYGISSVAIAHYPMYRGVARLVGMETREAGPAIEDLFTEIEAAWNEFDFVFAHVKETDKAGEDGDFDRKKGAIEEVDRHLPKLQALEPDVVVVTGDHSTPAALRAHSWHPVPLLLWGRAVAPDTVTEFGERACAGGGLGIRPAVDIMPLALAHAGRLSKFGA